MIAFTSLLWIWQGQAAGRWYFLTLPEEQSGEVKAHSLGQISHALYEVSGEYRRNM